MIENETALGELTQLADLILSNDRGIEVMVDDSVFRCSKDEVTEEEFLSFFGRGRHFAPYSFDAGLAAGHLLELPSRFGLFRTNSRSAQSMKSDARLSRITIVLHVA